MLDYRGAATSSQQIGNLLKVARVQFSLLALALLGFGALVALSLGAPFSLERLVLGFLIVLSAQLSVHFSNDYFDVESDRAGGTTLISGGAGVLLEHPELRETSRRIALGLIALSIILGILFMQAHDLPPWFMSLVLAGNLVGWIYSAPPVRLSQRGLGELCSIFVIGFLVPVTGYVTLKGLIDSGILLFLFPTLLYGLVLILTVEIPDLEDDRLSGKKNWIVRWGREFGFLTTGLSLLAATAYFFLLASFSPHDLPFDVTVIGWLSLLTLVPGLWGIWKRPRERYLATRISTLQIVLLAVFTILVDGYLSVLLLS